jgi:GNAT superfamily N-acetyltransferase
MFERYLAKRLVRRALAEQKTQRYVCSSLQLELRRYQTSLEIVFLETIPNNKGIGRVVIEDLQAYCHTNNLKLNATYVSESAIGFYEHLGFVYRDPHATWTPART